MGLKRTRRATGASPDKPRFAMPRTVSHAALLANGGDEPFRQALYLMVLAFGRLQACREAFGRAMSLSGSQFTVLIGTAYCQQTEGVSIRALADHVQLAATHVTTEVGRLIRKGLLTKRVNAHDRRSVLVKLSRRGEAALLQIVPFVRDVNDLLFADVPRTEFAAVSHFLRVFASNGERALAEIALRERGHATTPASRQRKRD